MFKSGGNRMAVGDRIKRARNLRGMTQKELGIAIGFEEKSADIRIAQYESNTRTPKEELLHKIAEVLNVNYRSLYEPTLYAAEDVMYTLFELDEHYPGTRLYEVTDTTDPDFPEKHGSHQNYQRSSISYRH
jgi:transcriptional regulator with XRE-family HTH domain